MDRVDEYYEEASYLALNIMKKEFMTLYAPDVKMFEADPRKIKSYFEKLRKWKNLILLIIVVYFVELMTMRDLEDSQF